MTGPTPHDPRAERFSALRVALRLDRTAVALLAAAAIALPGGNIEVAIGTMVLIGVIASAPLRVAWLAQRWLRKGDRLYGTLAVLLFALPIVGLMLSALA